MYDMVSNDCGSFLPGTLTNGESNTPAVVQSALKSSDESSQKSKKKKGISRSVSFSEAGPAVQQIVSVKSMLEGEVNANEGVVLSP